MINKLTSLFYREKTLKDLEKKIKLLGCKTKYNAVTFMNIRIITSIILFIFIIFSTKLGYLLAPVITYLYYLLLPNLFFDRKIKKRSEKLDRDGLYFFEVLEFLEFLPYFLSLLRFRNFLIVFYFYI